MKKCVIRTVVALCLILFINACCCGCQKSAVKTDKPVIVLTAFGTSVPKARKVFDYIDKTMHKKYAGHEIRWAFTSSIIRKKLKKSGVITHDLKEVIAQLRKENVKNIVIQSLHVVPGQEFNEINDVDTKGLNVAVGSALLTTDADINKAVAAVGKEIEEGCPNVVVAHGNDHHKEFNGQLVAFDKALRKQFPHAVTCSVEGTIGTRELTNVKVKAAKAGKVNFIPLMIVAGDHVMNDVLGSEEDTWKSIVGAKQTTCTKPLGYNDKILEVFCLHIDEALKKLDK